MGQAPAMLPQINVDITIPLQTCVRKDSPHQQHTFYKILIAQNLASCLRLEFAHYERLALSDDSSLCRFPVSYGPSSGLALADVLLITMQLPICGRKPSSHQQRISYEIWVEQNLALHWFSLLAAHQACAWSWSLSLNGRLGHDLFF